jgi:ketosteroid isomerase-like protein
MTGHDLMILSGQTIHCAARLRQLVISLGAANTRKSDDIFTLKEREMSTSHAQKQAVIEALYAATGVGDFDEAEKYLTEDFFVTEAEALPYAGVYTGKGALRELYTKVMGMMDVAGLEITAHCTTDGDYACTLLQFTFADPKLAAAPLAEMYRFRDGKVCEIKPYYFDPAPIIAACKAKVSV